MKNIISIFKKSVGIQAPEMQTKDTIHAQVMPSTFIPSTPVMRDAIAQFILKSLQPYVDEKGLAVAALHFYVLCRSQQETEAARVALYMDKPGLFKTKQLERILMNHFIPLEPGWEWETHLVQDQLPDNCLQQGNFGLKILGAGQHAQEHYIKAILQVLSGQAACSEYELDPLQQRRFSIGRGKAPQLASGKIQQNDIVFLGKEDPGYNELTGTPNIKVSRNHAFIIYEPNTGRYLLYPDKGGLP